MITARPLSEITQLCIRPYSSSKSAPPVAMVTRLAPTIRSDTKNSGRVTLCGFHLREVSMRPISNHISILSFLHFLELRNATHIFAFPAPNVQQEARPIDVPDSDGFSADGCQILILDASGVCFNRHADMPRSMNQEKAIETTKHPARRNRSRKATSEQTAETRGAQR